jgi:MFS family permease
MKKRSLWAIVLWDVALVCGPLVVGLILRLNGWSWASFRLALLAMYAAELILMLVAGWGPDVLRVRGKSYASFNAPAFDDVYAPPDRAVVEGAQMTRGIRDPIAVGPAIALAVVLLSFAVSH